MSFPEKGLVAYAAERALGCDLETWMTLFVHVNNQRTRSQRLDSSERGRLLSRRNVY